MSISGSVLYTEMLDFARKGRVDRSGSEMIGIGLLACKKRNTESSAEMPEAKDRVTLGLRHPPILSFTHAAPPQ